MSEYCERTDIERLYGVQNIVFFAKMGDEDTDEIIAARIAYFIGLASEDVEERARALGFQMPLVTESTGTTPTSFKHLTARLAGIMLYELLGMDSFSPEGKPNHKYWYQQLRIDQCWEEVKDGVRSIDSMNG